jgi:cyclic pyranopterin phosphate synthase
MVDVTTKAVTARKAHARAAVVMSETAFAAAAAGDLPKGDLLSVVRLAGVMAAKKTPELVPFCHPIRLTDIDVEAVLDPSLPGVRLDAKISAVDRTGAEMEALTACATAGLTVIDMVKALDPWARMDGLQVQSKSGGRSGASRRPPG